MSLSRNSSPSPGGDDTLKLSVSASQRRVQIDQEKRMLALKRRIGDDGS